MEPSATPFVVQRCSSRSAVAFRTSADGCTPFTLLSPATDMLKRMTSPPMLCARHAHITGVPPMRPVPSCHPCIMQASCSHDTTFSMNSMLFCVPCC